jgi:hypothetical protein
MKRFRKTMPLEIRFWSKVQKGNSDECWIWHGSKTNQGYGEINYHNGLDRHSNHNEYAHRVAWELTNGRIPEFMKVLHRCDNRLCVNPSHLFLGSLSDNFKDCLLKNRHPNKKLTNQQIHEIRK